MWLWVQFFFFNLCSEFSLFFINCVSWNSGLNTFNSRKKIIQKKHINCRFTELTATEEINFLHMLARARLNRNFTRRIKSMLPFQGLSRILLRERLFVKLCVTAPSTGSWLTMNTASGFFPCVWLSNTLNIYKIDHS